MDCYYPYDGINVLISSVVLFKLNTNNGDIIHTSNRSMLQFSFQKFFQADYAYVLSTENMMFSMPRKTDKNLYPDSYLYDVNLEYNDNALYHIIPVPTHLGGTNIGKAVQHGKYFFTDMASMVTLYNVNYKNYGDYGYNALGDYGAFISGTSYGYQGMSVKPGSGMESAAKLAYNVGVFAYDLLSDGSAIKDALKFVPYVNAAVTVLDIVNQIRSLPAKLQTSKEDVSVVDTFAPDFNGRDLQLAAFGQKYFSRNAAVAINSYGDNQLLIGDGEFHFNYQLHTQNMLWDSRYVALFSMKMARVTALGMGGISIKNFESMSSSISNSIYQYMVLNEPLDAYGNEFPAELPVQDYKEIPEVNAVNGEARIDTHILPNYYNLIKFTPDISDYYSVKGNYIDGNTSRLNVALYEVGNDKDYDNLSNPIKTSENGSIDRVWLESGKTYYVKSTLRSDTPDEGFYYGSISLDFNRATPLRVGYNTVKFYDDYAYVKVTAEQNRYYCVQSPGATIDLVGYPAFNVITEAPDGGVRLENGDSRYYRIARPSTSTETITVLVTTKQRVLLKPENGEDNIEWIVESGDYPTLPSPTRDGYRSYGWKEEGETEDKHVFDNTLPDIDKADIVLVMDWAKKYKVHYVTNGGSALPDDEFDERWSGGLNMDSVKTHYLFVGWYTDPNFSDDSGPINSFPLGTNTDQTVYAKWEIHEFSITFSSDGRVVQSIVVSKGGTITSPSISKDYHRGMWRSSMRNFITPGASYTCKGYNENFYMEWEVISPYTEHADRRDSTYTITDSGVFNQNYDNVFSFKKGQANIYSTVKIVVQFTAWEKDDGYQHVMLYDGSGSGATLLAEQKFEHGGNKKDTTAKRYEFTFELDMSKLANKDLCIRYSASGFGADTWYNNAMTCSVTYYE